MPRGKAKHKFRTIRPDECARLYQEVGPQETYQVSLRKPKTKEEIAENNRIKKEREEEAAARKSGIGIREKNKAEMDKMLLEMLKELSQ